MASGFFAVLDDIATLMDDVAGMSKVATKKTAGILGDDLAVNAEKASGFTPNRELPVLWAITKGSLLNKLIILPVAFLLSAFLPWIITIILLLGGLYLAFEGGEKVYEYFFPGSHASHHKGGPAESTADRPIEEKAKIKAAIVTDFILSVEIVIIALGTVTEEPILTQILVVSFVALVATIGVYGIVALIIRMDEFGYGLMALNGEDNTFSDKVGKFFVGALPKVIKALSVIGTLALLLVSGGIFKHNIHFLHDLWPQVPGILTEFLLGLVVGLLSYLIYSKVLRPD